MEKEERPRKNAFLTDKKDTCFNKDNKEDMLDPEHDGVVITLYVLTHFV